jgi:perosamine synthetase
MIRSPAVQILEIVRSVVGVGPRDLQRPIIHVDDIYCPYDILGYWAVDQFETKLREITNLNHVASVSSGTAALHLALMAVGVKAGDEVIVPTLTFAATANAICHCGAVPHFVDVTHSDLGINSFKLRQYLSRMTPEQRSRIKAIVPVHLLGVPCAIESIMQIATTFGIAVVEDASEALGTRAGIASDHVGGFGRAGVISFNNNKIVTTGGGGAVVTYDRELDSRVRHLSTQAKTYHKFMWSHDEVGWNYRMPNICAALGIKQLERLSSTLTAKRLMTARYAVAFAGSGVATLYVNPQSNCWLNAIMTTPHYPGERNGIINALLDEGYNARAIFTPLHLLPHFKDCPRQQNLMVAEDIFSRMVCLPSSLGGDAGT